MDTALWCDICEVTRPFAVGSSNLAAQVEPIFLTIVEDGISTFDLFYEVGTFISGLVLTLGWVQQRQWFGLYCHWTNFRQFSIFLTIVPFLMSLVAIIATRHLSLMSRGGGGGGGVHLQVCLSRKMIDVPTPAVQIVGRIKTHLFSSFLVGSVRLLYHLPFFLSFFL
jgi:hypothetical protein